MSSITLNGESRALPPGATLRDIVAATTGRTLTAGGVPQDGERLGVAVAVDAVVVPRSRWSTTALESGQTVEIITAMQGG
jgi:sulfur carrier protein